MEVDESSQEMVAATTSDQNASEDPASKKGQQQEKLVVSEDKEVVIEHATAAAVARTFVRITHEIHLAEERLTQLEILHRREIWLAYIKYEMLYMPLIEKRNKLMVAIPHIWPAALLNHPQLVVLFTAERERHLLKYVEEVQVRRCNESLSDFSIFFRFCPNPFIRNEVVVKTFYDGPNGFTTERSEIDWTDEGMDTVCQGPKRPGQWLTFLDVLLSDKRILSHPLPSRLADVFLRAVQEVCMKPMVFYRAAEIPGKDADEFASIVSKTKVQVFWYDHQGKDNRWYVSSGHLHPDSDTESDGEDQMDTNNTKSANRHPFSFARYDCDSDCFLMDHPKYAKASDTSSSDGLNEHEESNHTEETGITAEDIGVYIHEGDQDTMASAERAIELNKQLLVHCMQQRQQQEEIVKQDAMCAGDVLDPEKGKPDVGDHRVLLPKPSGGDVVKAGNSAEEDLLMTSDGRENDNMEIEGRIGQLDLNDD